MGLRLIKIVGLYLLEDVKMQKVTKRQKYYQKAENQPSKFLRY